MHELTLKHFVLKQQVINLYRQAIRASRAIPDKGARKETVTWIRSEFERNRDISDVDTIQDKITSGRRELKQFLPSMSLHASRT